MNNKLNLKVKVKNFGPVSKGEVIIKPLTIFIGPNNSGKSYISTLIHSIIKNLEESRFEFRLNNIDIIHKYLSELQNIVGNIENGKVVEIPQTFIRKLAKEVYKKVYEENLGKEIQNYYACSLKDLVKIGENSFDLKINYESDDIFLKLKDNELKIQKSPKIDENLKLTVKFEIANFPSSPNVQPIGRGKVLVRLSKKSEIQEALIYLIFDIVDSLLQRLLKSLIIINSYYLPASRSGIIQIYKILLASILKEITSREKFISKTIYDFLLPLIYIDTYKEIKSPTYNIAVEFEKEIISGEIKLEKFYLPEIVYNFENTQIPLHRTSSTISELAPLFIYLKYIVRLPSVLIIEEPEAHLHPLNQSKLAKLLVKLVRSGLYLVITTHSEYLLGQINNFISLSKIPENLRKEKYRSEDYLNIDEVSAYVFEYNEKSKGYIIKELEITEEDGISEEEFIKVHEALYEETFKIHKDLESGF
ncbi:MAG: AAA family ATPase [Candidatus Hydrothermia bacterium]